MSDNFPLTPGSGRNAATDQVTYSGDTADVQLTRPVLVTGAEGSKTVVDLDSNSGNKSSGTLRVVLATDQPQLTNAQPVTGDVAHDTADAGNPQKVGGQARTTNRTAVADADRVDFIADDLGRQVVVQGQVRDLIVHQHTQIASSSSETTIGTQVASTFLDLVQLVITNQTATAVNVTIKDSTGGTTRMIIALAPNGGAVITFARPVPQATVNTNWTATLSSAAVTVNIFAMFEKNV